MHRQLMDVQTQLPSLTHYAQMVIPHHQLMVVLTMMEPSLTHYAQMVIPHHQLMVVNDDGTFSDPLCSDGNPAPSADGCPNPTTSLTHYAQMVIQHHQLMDVQTQLPSLTHYAQMVIQHHELMVVLTMMEPSLIHYVQMVIPHQRADGCPNDDGTFSDPLCSDGNPAPSAEWMSKPNYLL